MCLHQVCGAIKGCGHDENGGANIFLSAENCSARSEWPLGPTAPANRNAATVITYQQHGRGPYLQFTGLLQTLYDGRDKKDQICSRQNVNRDLSRVVNDRAKSVRHRSLPTIPRRQPPNPEIYASFDRGWNEGTS